MSAPSGRHLVVVEAYEGLAEFVSDEPARRAASRALGLPVEEMAERLDCRVTVLCWDEWVRYEHTGLSFLSWSQAPATRPWPAPPRARRDGRRGAGGHASARVRWVDVPLRDPGHGRSFAAAGLSALSHGLLADSDPLFFASYCLHETLRAMARAGRIDAVVLPVWGGLGYVAQMARATGADGHLAAPFAVVVTDTSANRQRANQEGWWGRPAIVRRQMEDLSLALADLALVFGPRGEAIARAGRLPEAPPAVQVPRFVEPSLLDRISTAGRRHRPPAPVQVFLYEGQQAASGVLAAMDAVLLLRTRRIALGRPVICAGPPMIFAPMTPRRFDEYWSSRGAVRELVTERRWLWQREHPPTATVFPVRLYPSIFEHLPNVWAELARGSHVLLSDAAAEGLAPGETLPPGSLIAAPTAECVAHALARTAQADVHTLDEERRELCARVVAAHRGPARERLLDRAIAALDELTRAAPAPQNLARVARLLLDRRTPLSALGRPNAAPAGASPPGETAPSEPPANGRLTVVVTCYEMEHMLADAVHSVWNADRPPDELVLVDDGSHGDTTIEVIRALEREALANGLPLRVIRQRNAGLADARNTGLRAATGEYISFLDGDDLIEPAFYRLALPLLESHPGLGGVAAWAFCFGDGVRDGFWNAPQPELPLLFVENVVFVPCLARTELLRRLGGYDTGQRYNYEDWELSVRMLAAGWPIITIPMYLQRYRIRRTSLLRSMTCIQNQVMRERLLSTHRNVASHFTVEIAMQVEHRLMQLIHPANGHTLAGSARFPAHVMRLATRARWMLGSASRHFDPRVALPRLAGRRNGGGAPVHDARLPTLDDDPVATHAPSDRLS